MVERDDQHSDATQPLDVGPEALAGARPWSTARSGRRAAPWGGKPSPARSLTGRPCRAGRASGARESPSRPTGTPGALARLLLHRCPPRAFGSSSSSPGRPHAGIRASWRIGYGRLRTVEGRLSRAGATDSCRLRVARQKRVRSPHEAPLQADRHRRRDRRRPARGRALQANLETRRGRGRRTGRHGQAPQLPPDVCRRGDPRRGLRRRQSGRRPCRRNRLRAADGHLARQGRLAKQELVMSTGEELAEGERPVRAWRDKEVLPVRRRQHRVEALAAAPGW